jgi:hypothetical protein
VLALALVVVMVPVVLVVWFASFKGSVKADIRRLEARARARGEPLTFTEFTNKLPVIAPQSNAAVTLLEVWKREDPAYWNAFLQGTQPLPKRTKERGHPVQKILSAQTASERRTKPLTEEQKRKAGEFLEARRRYLSDVRLALDHPACLFPVKYSDGYKALMPHIAEMKADMQDFRLLVSVSTESGDVKDAIAGLNTIARISAALHQDPTLIGQVVSLSSAGAVLVETEALLTRHKLPPAKLDELAVLLAGLQRTNGFRRGITSERVNGLAAFDMTTVPIDEPSGDGDPESGEQAEESLRTVMQVLRVIGLEQIDRRLMLETYEQAEALAERFSPASLRQMNELAEVSKQKASEFPPKLISSLLLQSALLAHVRFYSLEARRRAAVTALAVERFRQANRRLPNSLAELVPTFLPAIPQDPFNGQPLRFRTNAPGYVVYSVGSDFTDDQGREWSRKQRATKFDQTFTVER